MPRFPAALSGPFSNPQGVVRRPMVVFGGRTRIPGTNAPCWPSWLAVAVPLVAVTAVCQGEGLEERRGLVPGVAPPVAWVFALGSSEQGRRPLIPRRSGKPVYPVAPVLLGLTMWANAFTRPAAHKRLAALQAPALLALVLAYRRWHQFATVSCVHDPRKRLSKRFHPGRVVTYPQRRHSTFWTWPPTPKPLTISMRR